MWVNGSAAAFWGTRDLGALGRNLASQAGPGSGLEGLVRGTTLWASPRLGRLRLARALRLRNHVMLFRTGNGADGALLMGLALPETAMEEEGPTDAWRRGPDEPGRIGSGAVAPASLIGEASPDGTGAQDPTPNPNPNPGRSPSPR